MQNRIREVLNLALRAPSAGNCQPWKFQIKENTLIIDYLKERGEHGLNIQAHASLCSLGILIEHIEIVATKYNFKLDISYDLTDRLVPLTTINFQESRIETNKLFVYINKRYTDRSLYMPVPIDNKLLDRLESYNRNNPYCKVRAKSGLLSESARKYLSQADNFLWTYKKARDDFYNWYRIADRNYAKKKDGLFRKHLALSIPEDIMLNFLATSEILRDTIAPLVASVAVKKAEKQYNSSSLFLIFSIKEGSEEKRSIIELGRLAARCWLELAKEEIAVQPMSQGVTPLLALRLNGDNINLPRKVKKLLLKGINSLSDEFNLSAEETPFWLLRCGKSGLSGRRSVTLRKECF